jgi:ATP-binding cassette subfamily D (ALD) protein 3
MLVKLAEAIGRLVLAGREMSRLAGFTSRMTELITVLNDLNKGSYTRTMVNSSSADGEIAAGKGIISFQDNIIKFEKVPLVTPNGDLLVKELTFEVRSGQNVLVCGPNGCGKSSLFRILGELWPTWGGKVIKPPRGKLFYIPQKPYMTLGTLRDQIIYPHTHEEMKRRGKTDQDLFNFLDLVQLRAIVQQREKGLDAIEDWIDVLSGGEKQRIAMARLFYHHPQFAILDECTSAVSVDVESQMYQYCRKVNITLFTVSHRRSLWTHHEWVMKFDGRGLYEFMKIEDCKEEFGS